jgi:LysR family transcriptional regulator, positive regulator for ilvC
MDTHSLRIFLGLAETLHFGKTSRQVNLSPSALSRTVQRMEEELGQPLFLRDNRSVQLTPAGERFRLYARQALQGWEALAGELSALPGLAGELTVYGSVAASYTVLAGLFQAFRERHPGVHIRLQTGDPEGAVERVLSGHADITVAARPSALPRSLAFRPIAVTPLEFIAPAVPCESEMLTHRPPIPWARVPLVLPDAGLSRRRAEAWFRARRVRPNVYAEVAGHEAIIAMVSLGCGVGVVPRLVLDRFARAREVRVLDVDPPLAPYIVGLCVRRRRLASPTVRAFWDTAPER